MKNFYASSQTILTVWCRCGSLLGVVWASKWLYSCNSITSSRKKSARKFQFSAFCVRLIIQCSTQQYYSLFIVNQLRDHRKQRGKRVWDLFMFFIFLQHCHSNCVWSRRFPISFRFLLAVHLIDFSAYFKFLIFPRSCFQSTPFWFYISSVQLHFIAFKLLSDQQKNRNVEILQIQCLLHNSIGLASLIQYL